MAKLVAHVNYLANTFTRKKMLDCIGDRMNAQEWCWVQGDLSKHKRNND